MALERRQIPIGGGENVSAIVAHPEPRVSSSTAVILAHGAGNDMNTPFLSAVQEGLAVRGYVSVKFNFPYTEAGRRVPAGRGRAWLHTVPTAVSRFTGRSPMPLTLPPPAGSAKSLQRFGHDRR